MTLSHRLLAGALLTACLLPTTTWARPARPATIAATTVSAADQKLTDTAAEAGTAEVKMAKLALSRSSEPSVKEFAQEMIDAHSSINTELMTWAKGQGLNPPTRLNSEHQSVYSDLSSLSGKSFDKAYMKAQVKDHRAAVALFTKGSQSANNGDLKNLFAKHEPHIEMHLAKAERTFKSL